VNAYVRKRVDDGQISLEELLDLGSGSYLRLAVAGSHEIGGLRRTISRRYNAQDIVDGGFVALTSIDIGRTESTSPDEVPSSEIDIKPDTTEVRTGFSEEEEEELDEE
jgi:hypothetical protein